MSSLAFARTARLPKAGGPRGLFVQVVAGLLIAAVASVLVLYGARGTTLKGIALGLVAVGSLWFLTTRNPQLGLALILLYLGLLDGYLKLASGSSIVTFVRDAFIFALAFGVLLRAIVTHRQLRLPALSGWLIAFIACVLVEFANPHAGTLEHSLAGARQHLEFVPLFFLTFAYVRTTRSLKVFCLLLAIVAAANGVVGWIQFKESPQQFAAWGPGYSERILGTGDFAGAGRSAALGPGGTTSNRPFGLGSDAGDGGLFGMVALCGIFALAIFSQRRRYQLFAVAMALLAILAIVTSQGRSVVLGSVVAVLAFGLLTLKTGTRLKSLGGLILVAIVAVVVIQGVVSSAGAGGLRYGGLGPTGVIGTTATARGTSITTIPFNLVHYPFGVGLASGGPAASSPGASDFQQNAGFNVETEFSFLVVETGIPGMVAMTGFVVVLVFTGLRRISSVEDPEARILIAALIAPLVAVAFQFFVTALTPTVPLGPYIFAVGGIISYWLLEPSNVGVCQALTSGKSHLRNAAFTPADVG